MTSSDELTEQVLRIQAYYPQIYLACHARHQRAGSHGDTLSDRDNRILSHLYGDRPVSPSALAAHLGIRASTLSEAVDRLVGRGFIRRRPEEHDQRRVELWLTPSGKDALGASSVLDSGRLRHLLARLTPEQQKRAVDGLALLAEATAPDSNRSF